MLPILSRPLLLYHNPGSQFMKPSRPRAALIGKINSPSKKKKRTPLLIIIQERKELIKNKGHSLFLLIHLVLQAEQDLIHLSPAYLLSGACSQAESPGMYCSVLLGSVCGPAALLSDKCLRHHLIRLVDSPAFYLPVNESTPWRNETESC